MSIQKRKKTKQEKKDQLNQLKLFSETLFYDPLVSKFVNLLMKNGKKHLAQSIIYRTFALINKEMKIDPLKIFYRAINNIKPAIEVKGRRIGGVTYKVPKPILLKRQERLALKWLIQCANESSKHTISENLTSEILKALRGQGNAVKKQQELHKLVSLNKAFFYLG